MAVYGSGTGVDITTLADKLLALRYLGSDVTIDTKHGVRTAARAQVVDLERKRNRGQTLIFQEAVAQEVRQHGADWVVGVFAKGPHPKKKGWEMWQIQSEGVDLAAATEILVELGLEAPED